ncbi:MAG TPA: 7-carboxy-7-deazaguanine synthase QueE [Patescibacteria group bacterium]
MKDPHAPPTSLTIMQPPREPFFIFSADGIFYSLNGEGATIGYPAVYARLHGCNLNCSWCDTPYTWNRSLTEFHEYLQRGRLSIPDTLEQLIAADVSGCKRLVFTGGEPLLQQKAIAAILPQLTHWSVEVETNGTIAPQKELFDCQFNCSPKLPNSGISAERAVKPQAIHTLKGLNTYFKFVVRTANDVAEMQRIYEQPFQIPRDRIILSPEGITVSDTVRVMQNLAEIAKDQGYRLTPRLHILLWGDTRRT